MINDTAPTTDYWDLAAIEIVADNSGGGVAPPTAPTNVSATVASSSEVDLSWTGSTSSIGIDHYNVIRNGLVVAGPTTTTYKDFTLTGGNTYTYTIVAVDTQGNQSGASNAQTVTTPAPGADQIGQVSAIIQWPAVAIHAALTPSGKILTFQGDFAQGGQQYLWDPVTGVQQQIPNAPSDLFCAGQAVLDDGRPLIIGGTATSGGLGIRDITAFNWQNEQWQTLAPMHYPRWYATGTTLSDGRVLVNSGYNTGAGDIVAVPEIYNPVTNTWGDLTAASKSMPIYPFIYQLPDGRILQAGASEVATATQVLDLITNQWTSVDARIIDGSSIINYAPWKFLKAGSAADDGNSGAATRTAYTLDMSQAGATWQPTASMQYPRAFTNLTALPDGSVLASGGGTEKSGFVDGNGVLPMEIWNPSSGQWTTVASLTEPRLYHSVATLLPDGRVFIAGGGGDPGVTDHKSAQIYSPPYLFKGPRPTITSAPDVVGYGAVAFIQTADAASIGSVSLIRTGSVTHSFDQNARALQLGFSQAAGGINVQMPANGTYAPPGYYLLSIVNSQGVPSISKFVRFSAPASDSVAPSAVTDLAANAISSNQVQLTWSASSDNVGVAGYNVLRGGVKVATTTTPGYVDNTVAPLTTYSYAVTAFDAAGNTSALSNTATTTTPADASPPSISNVAVGSLSTTSATITWTTDKPSDSQVFYGLTASYGSSTVLNPALVTSHSAVITGLAPGTAYHYQVRSATASGALGTSGDLTFTTPTSAPLAVDAQAFAHPTSSSTTLRSPAFSTSTSNELLVVFIASDGSNGSSAQTVTAVTGAGLTWTLRVRANAQPGDAEIWTAVATTRLTNVQVTATLSSSRVASMNVITFVGADTFTPGATAAKSASNGAPSASLTTTKAGSWVWGVGADWSRAVPRTVGAAQSLIDQYLAPVGDTYWVQRQTNATAAAGTLVTINDTAPTNDKWDLALIEIRSAQ
jgi:fibronectin type 3 domain-containing protein